MQFRTASLQTFMAACLAVSLLMLPGVVSAATVSLVGTIPVTTAGYMPSGGLTSLNGAYYGVTFAAPGTVYRLDLKTGAETVLYTFTGNRDGSSPFVGLTVLDGMLYGTTTSGGTNKTGVVFSIDPATGAETVVTSLPPATQSVQRLISYGGLLYGIDGYGANGAGSIFSVDPASGAFSVAYNFIAKRDGYSTAALLQYGTSIYGTNTNGGKLNGGTLFRFEPATHRVKIEYSFGAVGDGKAPLGALAEQGGLLYGTTYRGGTSGEGTIFSFQPTDRQEAVIHSFSGPDGSYPFNGLLSHGGLLYGATANGGTANLGVVFSFDPASGSQQENILYDATAPLRYSAETSPFIEASGKLIATSAYGGFGYLGGGFVASVDLTTGDFAHIHDFGLGAPTDTSNLVKVGQDLYGVSASTGANELGSIFKVVPNSNTVETAYDFKGPEGANPGGGLVSASGLLFGTTEYGGANNLGTLFSFDMAHRKLTNLHDFSASESGDLRKSLTLVDGKLYGTTSTVVFSLDTTTLQVQIVAPFTQGEFSSELTLFDGSLYGTAEEGGQNGLGSIFKIDPVSGSLTVLYSFQGGSDGVFPSSPLCLLNGVLYGSTDLVYFSNDSFTKVKATLFKFDPATNTKTTLRVLKNDIVSTAGLVVKGSKLFASFGESRDALYGGILELSPSTGHTTTYPFAYGQLIYPESSLLPTNGALFGTTPASVVTPPDQPRADTRQNYVSVPAAVYKFVP